MEKDQELLETIIKEIVTEPNEVKTERTIDNMGVLLRVHTAQSDMGSVIGKEGRTIQAIRTIINIIGRKNQANVTVKVGEDKVHETNN